MGVGWLRAFYTSMLGDLNNPPVIDSATTEKQERSPNLTHTPRSCAKLAFFSNTGSRGRNNPSTPKLQGRYAATLRCPKNMKKDKSTLERCRIPHTLDEIQTALCSPSLNILIDKILRTIDLKP